MTTCRSCDAEVVFVPSAKSAKPMILDAKPKKGVVVGTSITEAGGVHAFANPAIVESGGPGIVPQAIVTNVWTDHHVTCPNAADWKGKRR